MKQLLFILVILFLISNPFVRSSYAFQTGEVLEAEVPSQSGKSKSGVAERFLSFYRNHISPVDGDRCPSYPTCSSYSAKAFKKHGFVKGWLLSVDRLIHEGKEETAVSPRIYSDGRWKIYDPVENNDFWWSHPAGRDHDKE